MTIEFGADDIIKPNFFAEGVKYVYNKNKKKSLSDWIDEFCKTICIDYDLFSQPIVEADEEVEIEEKTKYGETKTKKIKIRKSKNPRHFGAEHSADVDPIFTTNVLKFRGRRIIVKGHVQSGKSNLMITGAFNFIKCGYSIVIVLRNNEKDKVQIKTRLEKMTKALLEFLPDEFKNQFNIKMLPDNFKPEDLAGQTVYISIGHEAPLKKYADEVAKNPDLQEKFVLFIDEVDFVDSIGTGVKNQLDRLKVKAFARFEVSATILDPLLHEDVDAGNVHIMRTPEFYKGIVTFNHMPLEKDNKLCTKIDDDIFVNDPNFAGYLQEMSTRDFTPFEFTSYGQYHPIISLARVSSTIDPNKRLLAHMKSKFPEIPAMYFDAAGVYLSIENEDRIELDNGDVSKTVRLSTRKDGVLPGKYLLFAKSAPGDILTWLYENGGFEKYPRVFMCAGVLAARGISFGASNFNECRVARKLWWHLTEMYVCVAETTDQAELMQIVGRLAGIYNDNVPPRLYATESVHKDVRSAYMSQEEFIERARKNFDISMKKSITTMPIFRGKLSKTRDLTKKAKYTLNIVNIEDDGGWSMDEYKVKFANELKKKVDKNAANASAATGGVPINMDKAAHTRLTKGFDKKKSMFETWAKTDAHSNISCFMKNIDPVKKYTKTEIMKLINETGVNRLCLVMTEKINKAGAYGLILKENIEENKEKTYQMYPELVAAYKKYFNIAA
jgi:hypothetical protein